MRRIGFVLMLALLLSTSLHAQQSTPRPRTMIGTSGQSHSIAPRAFGTLLYDQTISATGYGLVSQYETDDPASEFHSQAADDFVVPAEGWQIGGVFIGGEYFDASSGGADTVDVTIYRDANGVPDDTSIACQYLNYQISNDFAGELNLELDPVCNLSAGKYWLSVVVNMPYSNGQFGWEYRTETAGSVAVWRNPDNGFDTGCTNWTSVTACDAYEEGDPIEDDLVFQLYAASIPDLICTANTLFFEDNHDGVANNWTSSQGEGNNLWVKQTDDAYSQPNYWFVANIDPETEATDSYLTSASITVPAGASSVFLRFYHKYDMEVTFDGGVIEMSVNGGAFTDIGKDNFIQNGYNLKIVSESTSPLKGRPAFTGTQAAYIESVANLNVQPNDQIAIRFRQANDDFGAETNGGWWVDDVEVGYCTIFATETPAPTWTNTLTPSTETATPAPSSTVDATATVALTTTATVEQTGTPTAGQTPTATGEAGIQLIENGSFDVLNAEEKPVLVPWTVKNGVGDKTKCNKVDKVFARTGNCAFQFKGSAVEASSLRQDIDLTGLIFNSNSILRLSVFAKATNAAVNTKVKLRVTYSDGADKGKITLSIIQNEDYTEFPDTLSLASANIQKIKLQISNKSTAGKVLIDDVSLHLYESNSLLPLP
jgi:hypothetical protein